MLPVLSIASSCSGPCGAPCRHDAALRHDDEGADAPHAPPMPEMGRSPSQGSRVSEQLLPQVALGRLGCVKGSLWIVTRRTESDAPVLDTSLVETLLGACSARSFGAILPRKVGPTSNGHNGRRRDIGDMPQIATPCGVIFWVVL